MTSRWGCWGAGGGGGGGSCWWRDDDEEEEEGVSSSCGMSTSANATSAPSEGGEGGGIVVLSISFSVAYVCMCVVYVYARRRPKRERRRNTIVFFASKPVKTRLTCLSLLPQIFQCALLHSDRQRSVHCPRRQQLSAAHSCRESAFEIICPCH